MSTQEGLLARLRRKNAMLRGSDEGGIQEETIQDDTGKTVDQLVMEESIAMLRLRPVLPIKNDQLALEFIDAEERENWAARLDARRAVANAAIPAVGRIELTGSRFAWVGTGWLIDENILVTNRHVAKEFARRDGQRFAFQPGTDGALMTAHVDFAQEIGGTRRPVLFELVKPLWVEAKPGPDVAFFEIARTRDNTKLPTPIELAAKPTITDSIATIGYPAYDSRIPQPEQMRRIFGDIYDKKRFAPGSVVGIANSRLEHDCTTLGGSSGSLVLDLETGKAIGLHFSGSYLDRNYGVPSDAVRALLDRVKSGAVWVGGPDGTAAGSSPRPRPPHAPRREREEPIGEEARVEDYRGRTGYDVSFLLDARDRPVEVELPRVVRDEADILEFEVDGERQHVLPYEHYSVVMSRSRRMCFFSATNIDGNEAKKAGRVGWKWDPRIPKSQQIMHECYGPTPKFSRGHMTRREDPGWGTPTAAKRGNEDSMHVTNACPQMQAFNSPIWLALEDYALQHAKEDRMRISVFTGPYFDPRDPTRDGVRIPVAFWKVIAFIHDDTGKLCATGYDMDQHQSLEPADEFVFGQFVSRHTSLATQVPIKAIELRSGIDFGALANVDPLAREHEESVGGPAPLTSSDDIRFV